jgi:NADH-quinone oxidoreductase subunit C
MEEKNILTGLREALADRVLDASSPFGDDTIIIRPAALREVMDVLRAAPYDFTMLLDLTVVDFPDRAERFEIVYHLLSIPRNRRIRIKLSVGEANPAVASLTPIWKNADWLEREAFDMFGVTFEGHPYLRRLFMYDGFEGHPLRKDYGLRHRQPRLPLRKP